MDLLTKLLVQYPILLFAIIVHEYAHGKTAEFFGDDTARVMGRLTFNPLAHIDLFGTVLLPLLSMISGIPLFGWAKPVPVNFYVLSRTQIMLVGFAGPFANFLTAGIFGGIYYLFSSVINFNLYEGYLIFVYSVIINIILGIFNLIPIPPLDGSKVLEGLLPYELSRRYELAVGRYGFFILIFLLYSGVLWRFILPLVNFFIKILLPNLNMVF